MSVRDPIASIVGDIPHRMALAGGTRKVALGLWGGEVPDRPPAELVRELYQAENKEKVEPCTRGAEADTPL